MSTVKANDLMKVDGGIPTVKGQKLIPTAWVNFNGTGTIAIRDSENISSLTDLGTCQYQPNFTATMPDVNYAAIAVVGSHVSVDRMTAVYNLTTSSFSITAYNLAGDRYDQNYIAAVVLGGQA